MPASEYAAAREGAALVELSDRGVLAASGPQRLKFLHNMLSNDVTSLAPGQGTLASLMDVKGHLLALMRVLVTENAVLLEMPKQRLLKVQETLIFYKVGAPVRFEERTDVVLAVIGPHAQAALAVPQLANEAHLSRELGGVTVRIARASDLPAAGFVVHVAPEHAESARAALIAAGATPITRETFDVLRIEDGRPWFGPDVSEEHLLHETGLLREYHSSSKGCYVGQEVVARLEGRGGHVNKQLRGLRLEAAAAPGDAVQHEGKDVGILTSTGVSPRLGPVALAYLHRSAFAPGTSVAVGGRPATVVALPFPTQDAA
jgi:tRNA-modifying protein YgfZ